MDRPRRRLSEADDETSAEAADEPHPSAIAAE
jgi:hypothetical protein